MSRGPLAQGVCDEDGAGGGKRNGCGLWFAFLCCLCKGPLEQFLASISHNHRFSVAMIRFLWGCLGWC